MGKLEVRGSASKTVEYDLMKIVVDFHALEKTAKEASQKVMHECEEFLGILKNKGIDISKISLSKDRVDRSVSYCNGEEAEYYRANRVLEIETDFNMKMINDIRTIIDNNNAQAGFDVKYELSNEDNICQELMIQALKDAKKQAEELAHAIDQKVVGLISADKNAPKQDAICIDEVSCLLQLTGEREMFYEHSDELSPSNVTFTETIFTTWEIG